MKRIVKYSIVLIICIMAAFTFFRSYEIVPKYVENDLVQIDYWTFDEMYKKFMATNIANWNAQNTPTIELNTSVYSLDELDYKLWTSLQSGINAPDVVDLEHSKLSRYMEPKINYLVPLNSIIDPKKDMISDLSYSRYQRKGLYYAIDYYDNNAVIFYNKAAFEEISIDPGKIETFEQYIDAGKKLKAETGKYLLVIDYTDDLTYEILITKEDSGYLDIDGNIHLNCEKNIKVLEILHSLIHTDGIAIPAPTGDYFSYEFYSLINSGEVASIIAPYWYKGYIKEYMPEFYKELYTSSVPSIFNDSRSTAKVSGVATAITNQCEKPILLKNILRDTRLQKSLGTNIFYNLSGDPIVNESWNDLLYKAEDNKFSASEVQEIKLLSSIRLDYKNIEYPENYTHAIREINNNILFQVLKENTKSPKEALDEAQTLLFESNYTLENKIMEE
ncbi:MAG: carbohydrate ABC transporter substrate-binding protein [Clostridiaceae bacterium]|nr:carbohydrate ABC transporter substrate-binding protein [Clostridiaceae bacterium]